MFFLISKLNSSGLISGSGFETGKIEQKFEPNTLGYLPANLKNIDKALFRGPRGLLLTLPFFTISKIKKNSFLATDPIVFEAEGPTEVPENEGGEEVQEDEGGPPKEKKGKFESA